MARARLAALLVMIWIASAKCEVYQYGNGLWPRDHDLSEDNVTLVLRSDLGIPRDGNVTGWSVYTNTTGRLMLQVWRITSVDPVKFRLIGSNAFEIVSSGLQVLDVYEDNIAAKRGDFIGVRLLNSSVVTYSIPPQGCPLSPYKLINSSSPKPGDEVTFSKDDKICVIMPVRVFIHSSSIEEQTTQYTTLSDLNLALSSVRYVTPSQSSMPPDSTLDQTTAGLSRPDIQLVNGRKANEGIVLVRQNGSDEWLPMCDKVWTDALSSTVCQKVGFTGGIPKYFPFFGFWSESYHRFVSPSCFGSEENSQCSGMDLSNITDCRHGQPAAVQCAGQSGDIRHVQGYPAVSRQQTDTRPGINVIIPHPHHTFPWTSGTIRYWSFYLSADMEADSYMALQVWRRRSDQEYTFVGESVIHGLQRGVHTMELGGNNSDERIHFQAGDVIGIRFKDVNLIPYDIHPDPCTKDNSLDRIDVEGVEDELIPGQSYPYTRTREDREDCKMYSVFATYVGSERYGSNIFSLEHSLYEVITTQSLSWDDADEACAQALGHRSGLVIINTELEFSGIVGMLNSMNIHDDVWIGNVVGSGDEGFRYWAHCHPRRGETCVYLGRPRGDEYFDESGDLVYMYTDQCESTKYFLCERSRSNVRYGEIIDVSPRPSLTPSPGTNTRNLTYPRPDTGQTDVISQKVIKQGLQSIIVAPLTTAVLLFSCLLIIAIIYILRRQRRKYSRDSENSESTVRFVSLYDKAALSSMDC